MRDAFRAIASSGTAASVEALLAKVAGVFSLQEMDELAARESLYL